MFIKRKKVARRARRPRTFGYRHGVEAVLGLGPDVHHRDRAGPPPKCSGGHQDGRHLRRRLARVRGVSRRPRLHADFWGAQRFSCHKKAAHRARDGRRRYRAGRQVRLRGHRRLFDKVLRREGAEAVHAPHARTLSVWKSRHRADTVTESRCPRRNRSQI